MTTTTDKPNQLQTIVDESGLDSTKAAVILKQFQDYFTMASEWESKAKAIVVTDEGQTTKMKMAREGRLFLKKKRVAIEKTRKELKEQALREGKAIDGIANVLKALIVPIEEHLDEQEHFVERKRAAQEAEERRLEEEMRVEREKAEEAERQERERKLAEENERLRQEAREREKRDAAEREAREKEQRERDEQARKEREAIEAKARKEREEADRKRREAEEKARREREEQERRHREEQEKAERERRELEERLARMVVCPECGYEFDPKEGME